MPPPENKSKEPNVSIEIVSNLQTPGVTIVDSQPVFPALAPGYYIPAPEQQQQQPPPGQELPWWIPSENDELPNNQWFNQNQINNLLNNSTDDKTKCQNLKRKAESIDHSLDAGNYINNLLIIDS